MIKYEIQVIVFLIMLTRSSERIFNQTRCTGITILGLAEPFKTINQSGPTVTFFDGLFVGSIRDRDV